MATIGKTQQEIAQEILGILLEDGQQSDADVSNVTTLKDLADTVASQLADAYKQLETARRAASLKNYSDILVDALSSFAISNYSVLRAEATVATGTVTFRKKTVPTTNISVPVGTIIRTRALRSGATITYTTDRDAVLLTTAVKNSLTGYWEVDCPVTASTAGTGQHVGSNALTEMPNRTAGIDSVTNNSAINNATDRDDNETLALRVLVKTAGSNLGTGPGYESLLVDQLTLISEAAVIGPFDSDNLRVQFENEVDISIKSTIDAESFTSTLTTGGADLTYFGTERPVVTVATVVGTTNGQNYARNVDWGFNRDTGPVYGYSFRSFDALCWFPGKTPGPGLRLTVQGTKDTQIIAAQNYLDDPAFRYITGDLLAKSAVAVPIDVTLSAGSSSGVDRTQLRADIESALSAFFSGLHLGDDVQEDDIVKLIQNLDGVDFVEVPITVKKSTDSEGSNVVDIRAQEYATAGTLTITVT